MIRRDYILRMIEEFIRALAKISQQKEQRLWREAEESLDGQAQRLTGQNLASICAMADTELLASLLKSGEFQATTEKSLILARILVEAAEVAQEEKRDVASRSMRLRALHLLLHTSLRGEVYEWPEFAPTIGALLLRLSAEDLPIHTQALLMQHFERAGEFAKAEDSLHAMLERMPENPKLRELALSFYHRLLAQSDAALERGNLPRQEVEEALAALRAMPKP